MIHFINYIQLYIITKNIIHNRKFNCFSYTYHMMLNYNNREKEKKNYTYELLKEAGLRRYKNN